MLEKGKRKVSINIYIIEHIALLLDDNSSTPKKVTKLEDQDDPSPSLFTAEQVTDNNDQPMDESFDDGHVTSDKSQQAEPSVEGGETVPDIDRQVRGVALL